MENFWHLATRIALLLPSVADDQPKKGSKRANDRKQEIYLADGCLGIPTGVTIK